MRRVLLFGVVALVCLSGCAARVKALESSKTRVAPSAQAETDVKEVVAGNTAFALDLYHKLPADRNLVISPYSLSLVLAMTYAGARRETEKVMAQALHFTLPQDRLHAAFNALDRQVAEIGEGGPMLRLADSVWMQRGFPVRPEYLDLLAENYGAGLNTVDFARDGAGALRAINAWVEEKTEDRIKGLVPGHDTSQTVLMLVNAVYVNAEWERKFSEHGTEKRTFTLLDGKKVQTDAMFGMRPLGIEADYAEGTGYQALELFYKEGRLSMVFLLPAPGKFREFERVVSAEGLGRLWQELPRSEDRYGEVIVQLPKFAFESGSSMKGPLTALGLGPAFGRGADLSGMASVGPLWIEDVWHKGFIAVHEKGTEAAAASAVAVAMGAARPATPIPRFIADRPFLFVLRDRKTNAVLFLGRVLDPRS